MNNEIMISMNSLQLTTIIYIGLAFFFVLCVGAVSAIYMRSVNDKRRNQVPHLNQSFRAL